MVLTSIIKTFSGKPKDGKGAQICNIYINNLANRIYSYVSNAIRITPF